MKATHLAAFYGLAGMMAAGMDYPGYGLSSGGGTSVDLNRAARIRQQNEEIDKQNKGLKPYSQQGITVYARNDKNGFRKLKAALLGKGLIYNEQE